MKHEIAVAYANGAAGRVSFDDASDPFAALVALGAKSPLDSVSLREAAWWAFVRNEAAQSHMKAGDAGMPRIHIDTSNHETLDAATRVRGRVL